MSYGEKERAYLQVVEVKDLFRFQCDVCPEDSFVSARRQQSDRSRICVFSCESHDEMNA